MQCFNCAFENIPGMERCVRCQSLLGLSQVTVRPPRASGVRWGTRLRRACHQAGAAAGDAWRALPRWRPTSQVGVPWEAVAWSIIPGLGHLKHGNKLTGWLLLGGWLTLLLLAVLTVGLNWCAWCLAGAAAIHAAAILSFLGPELASHSVLARAGFGLVLFLALQWVIYGSVGWLGNRFYTPFPVTGLLPGPLIQAGDTVLHQGPWMRQQTFNRGDLVSYRMGLDERAGYEYVVHEGFGLDRIVGVTGDHVELKEGRLLVNGQPPRPGAMPLGDLSRLADLTVRVEEGEYAILPSRLNFTIYGNVRAGPILGRLSVVRDENVLGRVILRLHPWSRFGRIQ